MSQQYGVRQQDCCSWLNGGECGSQCSWTETPRDRRNSNLCDNKTQVNTHMSEVGERKESICFINDNPKQNSRRGSHSMIKTRGRGQLKCDGTRAGNIFRLLAKRTSPFKSAGASVQSTTGSRGMRISFYCGQQCWILHVPRQCEGYWLPTPFASFPFTSPPVRHRVPSHFNWSLHRTEQWGERQGQWREEDQNKELKNCAAPQKELYCVSFFLLLVFHICRQQIVANC